MKVPHVFPAVCALLLGLLAPTASVILHGHSPLALNDTRQASIERESRVQTFENNSSAKPVLDTPGSEWKLRIHPVVPLATIQAYAHDKLTPGFVAADAQFALDRAAAQRNVADMDSQVAANSAALTKATKQAKSSNKTTAQKAKAALPGLTADAKALKAQQGAATKALGKLKTKPTVKQWGCLVELWNHESGWDVYAKNPNGGAYGIPQSLPANKMSAQADDWQYNYKTQIDWGLNYISDRYQTPCNAWKLWQQNDPHWY
jgi:hypothetical protein